MRRLCSIDGCARPHHAHGWCAMHLQRWEKHDDPEHVEPIRGRPPKGDVPGYDAAHKRTSRQRGQASSFPCADGCGRVAAHWALAVTPQLYDPDTGWGYSLDPADYVPLCVSCHHVRDGITIASRDRLGRIATTTELP